MRVLCLILISLLLYGCARQRHDVFRKKSKPRDTLDVVIVPGITFEKQWEELIEQRVIWSWLLYRNGVTKNLLFSGGAVNTPYYECRIMGLMAEKLGVPKERIFYDSIAEHSVENVLYSMIVARKHDFRSVGLATDPVQAFFLKKYIRKRFRSQIVILPMLRDSLKKYNSLHIEIDSKMALVKDVMSLLITFDVPITLSWKKIFTNGNLIFKQERGGATTSYGVVMIPHYERAKRNNELYPAGKGYTPESLILFMIRSRMTQ